MDTVREHFEKGDFNMSFIDYFIQNRGNTPMCWHEIQRLEDGKARIRCSWLKEWMEPEEFFRKCLECQQEMERMLKERGSLPSVVETESWQEES